MALERLICGIDNWRHQSLSGRLPAPPARRWFGYGVSREIVAPLTL
jgi:hypothetical protein